MSVTSGESIPFEYDYAAIEQDVNALVNGGTAVNQAINQTLTPPEISAITAPVEPTQVDTEIQISANITSPGMNYTVTCDWGDGNVEDITPAGGSQAVNGSHTYSVAGVYTIRLKL